VFILFLSTGYWFVRKASQKLTGSNHKKIRICQHLEVWGDGSETKGKKEKRGCFECLMPTVKMEGRDAQTPPPPPPPSPEYCRNWAVFGQCITSTGRTPAKIVESAKIFWLFIGRPPSNF
jgi:hypothetical protein